MLRSRLSLFIVLVMLVSSVLSTEATEVWCRVAVGATALDDDDGPYFTCPALAAKGTQNNSESSQSASTPHGSVISASASSDSIVDEPIFSLPQLGVVVLPSVFIRVIAPTATTIAHTVETRGPPARPDRFVRPPPRAPPLSRFS